MSDPARTGRPDYDQLLRLRSIPRGEPTFLLRAQDVVGAQAVRAYVQLAKDAGAEDAFLEMAASQADAMAKWPVKKLPDVDLEEAGRKQLAYAWGRREWNGGAMTAEAIAERRGRLLCLAELYQPIVEAPRDGTSILAYGVHVGSPPDAAKGVMPGDHWWALLQWDIWREPHQFVFCKDGKPPWSEPLAFLPLVAPEGFDA